MAPPNETLIVCRVRWFAVAKIINQSSATRRIVHALKFTLELYLNLLIPIFEYIYET